MVFVNASLRALLGLAVTLLMVQIQAEMVIKIPHFRRGLKHLDISSLMDAKSNVHGNEGEAHDSPNVPDGAQLISLPVGNDGDKVAVYWSAHPDDSKVEQAFVMMHGRLRDGDHYWEVMNNALKWAQEDNYDGASKETIIVAPQMYSSKLNKGQFDDKTLAWDDVNAWESGAIATHPKGTNLTSMDALDAILDHFSDSKTFPNIKNVTMVGHGGGAQLMNRYAMTGKDPQNKDIYVRYIVGDPSSSPYFTEHRPVSDKSIAKIDDCDGYNTWRYGFENFTGTLDSKLQPKDYFGRYIRRDVVNIVGLHDIQPNGDQKCMAILQGGKKRRDRNLSWWRYINMLAKTKENLQGYPGNFSDLPDWSDVYENQIGARLVVVEDAEHDAEKVFSSSIGRSALFDHYNIKQGWRPNNDGSWNIDDKYL